MFDISYAADAVTFVNTKTLKAEKIDLFEAFDDIEAIRVLDKEFKGRKNASNAAVSLLSKLLNNPRLDGYKGTCPINENIPAELKQAVRDLETKYFEPLFSAPLAAKGMKPGA